MDVLDTYAVICQALKKAREERQPVLVEAITYRFRGHSMADPEEYRTKEQVEEWRQRDPISTFSDQLVEAEVLTPDDLEELDREAVAVVDEAVAFADNSPHPEPESLYDDIYVLGGQVRGWYSVDERSAGVHKGEDERDMADDLGARSDAYEETAKSLDKQDTETDDDTPAKDAEKERGPEGAYHEAAEQARKEDLGLDKASDKAQAEDDDAEEAEKDAQ